MFFLDSQCSYYIDYLNKEENQGTYNLFTLKIYWTNLYNFSDEFAANDLRVFTYSTEAIEGDLEWMDASDVIPAAGPLTDEEKRLIEVWAAKKWKFLTWNPFIPFQCKKSTMLMFVEMETRK